jgi:hypothetical protein
VSVFQSGFGTSTSPVPTTETEYISFTIDAPTSGRLLILSSCFVAAFGAFDDFNFTIRLNGGIVDDRYERFPERNPEGCRRNVTHHAVAVVPAGTHTVSLTIRADHANTMVCATGRLSAQFLP